MITRIRVAAVNPSGSGKGKGSKKGKSGRKTTRKNPSTEKVSASAIKSIAAALNPQKKKRKTTKKKRRTRRNPAVSLGDRLMRKAIAAAGGGTYAVVKDQVQKHADKIPGNEFAGVLLVGLGTLVEEHIPYGGPFMDGMAGAVAYDLVNEKVLNKGSGGDTLNVKPQSQNTQGQNAQSNPAIEDIEDEVVVDEEGNMYRYNPATGEYEYVPL